MKRALVILSALAAAPAGAKCVSLPVSAVETVMTGPNGRIIPVTIIAPIKRGRYPVVAFSHGAFAAPSRYRAMLDSIAAAGYVIVAPTHVDSELMKSDKPPSQAFVWQSRNEDMALALAATPNNSDKRRRAAMGHSYGALIAQVAAGAVAANAPPSPLRPPQALVAWSPPGPMPGLIDARGWSSIGTAALTITGTADILPGFINQWELHRIAHDQTPPGARWLWVGQGIDHYFGGMFGREKHADSDSRRLFGRAIATAVSFLDTRLNRRRPCSTGAITPGEMFQIDK